MERTDLVERFASQCIVQGTTEEVLLQFATMVEPTPEGVRIPVHTRLVLTLPGAKRLALSLGQLIHQHEVRFGAIPVDRAAAEPSRKGGTDTRKGSTAEFRRLPEES